MSTKISHSGVIESMEGNSVHVRIVQTSACAACKVAGYCNAAESKEKIVDVTPVDISLYKVGQVVTVSASGQVAARALLWQTVPRAGGCAFRRLAAVWQRGCGSPQRPCSPCSLLWSALAVS